MFLCSGQNNPSFMISTAWVKEQRTSVALTSTHTSLMTFLSSLYITFREANGIIFTLWIQPQIYMTQPIEFVKKCNTKIKMQCNIWFTRDWVWQMENFEGNIFSVIFQVFIVMFYSHGNQNRSLMNYMATNSHQKTDTYMYM